MGLDCGHNATPIKYKNDICINKYVFVFQIISGQCISNPETVAASLLADAIGIPEGLSLGSNVVANNMPIGPNMPTSLPMPMNNMAIATNMGLPVGSNIANNLAMGSNWALGPASSRLGLPGSISPAAMAPAMGIAAANGGAFTVTSSSPIAPTGLTVNSENAIEGSLIVSGQLPFLGSVAMDGSFPTTGGGMVSYGCGDGNIGMVNEGLSSPISQTLAPTMGYGSGIPGGQFNGLPARGFNGLY